MKEASKSTDRGLDFNDMISETYPDQVPLFSICGNEDLLIGAVPRAKEDFESIALSQIVCPDIRGDLRCPSDGVKLDLRRSQQIAVLKFAAGKPIFTTTDLGDLKCKPKKVSSFDFEMGGGNRGDRDNAPTGQERLLPSAQLLTNRLHILKRAACFSERMVCLIFSLENKIFQTFSRRSCRRPGGGRYPNCKRTLQTIMAA